MDSGQEQGAARRQGQAQQLLRTLERLRDPRANNKPHTIAIIFSFNLAFIVLFLTVVLRMPWPFWIYAVGLPLAVAALLLLARVQVQRLKVFRRWIGIEIERRGMLERLALGFHELPDIHAYTSFPWSLFLGARPRTLPSQARLVARHLEWYLADEPRPYFRMQWLMFAFTAVPSLLPFFIAYVVIGQPPWIAQVPAEAILISLLGLIVLVVMPLGMWLGYLQAKQSVAAEELFWALYRRCTI